MSCPQSDTEFVDALLEDLDASPTPYHAVERAAARLDAAGFQSQPLGDTFSTEPGARYIRRGGALVAWVTPSRPIDGFLLIGAHTDSPNLRVKANAAYRSGRWEQLGMEIYGGVLLNSWLDRDLGLAGRVTVKTTSGVQQRLVRDDRTLLRIPQLAIHLDREVNQRGLILNPQTHMDPVWDLSPGDRTGTATKPAAVSASTSGSYEDYLAELAGVEATDILASEIMAFDVQPASRFGRAGTMFASARIDNLVSSFCGVHALTTVAATNVDSPRMPVLVLYDHEEIGSATATGAAGRFIAQILERIAAASGHDRTGFLELLARSLVVSADGAHATHPNYPERHEPEHHVHLNEGVVIKRNANQRYATDADSEWFIRAVAGGLALQVFHTRDDMPCGSTIGPITAAGLAVPTIDIGAPQLAMHSIREMAGTADVVDLRAIMERAWRYEGSVLSEHGS